MPPDLSIARKLVEVGVPVYNSGLDSLGMPFRTDWPNIQPDMKEVDNWKPGMGLLMITGKVLDGADYDPRNDPDGSGLKEFQAFLKKVNPNIYGYWKTRSGGRHWWIASLGLPKCDTIFSGVEYKGVGGCLFIHPTVRRSKEDPVKKGYELLGSLNLDGPFVPCPELKTILADPENREKVPLKLLSKVDPGKRRTSILPHILRLQTLYDDEDVVVMGQALHDQLGWPCDERYIRGMLKKDVIRVVPGELYDSPFEFVDMSQVGMPEPVKLSPGQTSIATKINYIFGSAGDGKTRLVYWDVLQRARNGERWAIYDREMGPEGFREAMTELGATEGEIKSIFYIGPDATANLLKYGKLLTDFLIANEIDGIVYDSLAVFLGAAGIQENDQTQIRNWFDKACRPIKVSWVIDHTGHENADHGRGASAKGDAVDFALHLTTVKPFSKGQDGEIELTVAKARGGTFQKLSKLSIEVKTSKDGSIDRMDFCPGFWSAPRKRSEMTLAELIEDILKYREETEVTTKELQENMGSVRKTTKLKLIREAVGRHEISERRVSQNEIYYSVPEYQKGKVNV